MFPNYSWIFLITVILISVFIDLGISLRNSKKLSIKSAMLLSILWVALAMSVIDKLHDKFSITARQIAHSNSKIC